MDNKYYIVIIDKDGKIHYSSYIYNGLEFRNIYYVHNYKIICMYLPFVLQFFYLHINDKKIRLRTLPYN